MKFLIFYNRFNIVHLQTFISQSFVPGEQTSANAANRGAEPIAFVQPDYIGQNISF